MKVVISPRAAADLERLRQFLFDVNPQASERAVRTLAASIRSLRDFPGRGRPVAGSATRELIVTFGKAGYVVRYFQPARHGDVLVLRIWHGRESRD